MDGSGGERADLRDVKRVLILGDGAHELDGGAATDSDSEPALHCLIRRLAGDSESLVMESGRFREMGKVSASLVVRHAANARAHAYRRKTMYAMQLAKQKGFDGVAILLDRDRKKEAETLTPLREGRDSGRDAGGPPCAVGVAVETFDAWMIADAGAIESAGGDKSKAHPSPEHLDGKEGTGRHPKERAREVFTDEEHLGPCYRRVARSLDLDLLRKHCPKGFAPFAEDVEEQIGPLVADTSG